MSSGTGISDNKVTLDGVEMESAFPGSLNGYQTKLPENTSPYVVRYLPALGRSGRITSPSVRIASVIWRSSR